MRRFLGQAVWAYVADIYGLPTIANVLYMTRITRSPENGFRLATGSYLAGPGFGGSGPPPAPCAHQDTTSICRHSNRRKPCDKRAERQAQRFHCASKGGTNTPSLCLRLTAPNGPSPPTNAGSCAWARWMWPQGNSLGMPFSVTVWHGSKTTILRVWPGILRAKHWPSPRSSRAHLVWDSSTCSQAKCN